MKLMLELIEGLTGWSMQEGFYVALLLIGFVLTEIGVLHKSISMIITGVAVLTFLLVGTWRVIIRTRERKRE